MEKVIRSMSNIGDLKQKMFLSNYLNSKETGMFEKLLHVVKTGEAVDNTFCHSNGGSSKWFHIVVQKCQDTIIVSLDDVTEQKLSEEKANEQAYFLEQVVVATPDFIHIIDMETQKVIYANRIMYEDLGYTTTVIKELNLGEVSLLHHPDDRDKLLTFRESFKTAKDEEVNEYTCRILARNGSWIWYKNRGRVFKRNEAGHAMQFLMISRNITREKLAEEALRQSRELIDQVMRFTPDQIAVTDAETNLVLYTNHDRFADFARFGYTAEELLKLDVYERMRLFLKPSDWEAYREFIEKRRFLADDEILQHEYCIEVRDSQWEWFIIRSKVFKRDVEGNATQIISFTNSINKQKQSDETISQLNRMVVNKSEKLESLNSELKTFGSIAAHDYLDALRSTYTQLEFIILNDARNLSDAGKANVRRAQSGIQKMKLLTEDIVAYSQIPSLDDKASLVDLNEVLKNVLYNMSKTIEETEADIICDQLPVVQGFTYLVFLLFYHVIANAIKFRNKNVKPVIQIAYNQVSRGPEKKLSSNGTYEKISIKDNGIGFEEKNAENIFIIFYRLNDKSKYKGSGVGLAICKKIMDIHNGFITADSIPGKGTTFNCFFQSKESVMFF
ncbi:MAG: ATP-binding protein [Pedobacter agri]